jgi:thiamine-monophosphate kinase
MDKERDVIENLHEAMGNRNIREIFLTDAQPLEINGMELLFTVDEYSSEDYFLDDDPLRLGWNLVVATLSDILAAGGVPQSYAHSMTIPVSWDKIFIESFGKGIKNCLEAAKANFIGGDTGFGNSWKYTGIAIGTPLVNLNRSGAKAKDSIYTTGHVGAGNLEAAARMFGSQIREKSSLQKMLTAFPYRAGEAELIRKYASSCTDSSDGMLNALMNLAGCSQLGFLVDKLPYLAEGLRACELLNADKTLLFMGECGEYELVFTIPQEKETGFLAESSNKGMVFTKIGGMTVNKEYILKYDENIINFENYDIHARNFGDIAEYLDAINDFLIKQKK